MNPTLVRPEYLPVNIVHALTGLANSIQEVCGFVLNDGSFVVIPNDSLNPREQFWMQTSAQHNFVISNGDRIIALFHTHPRGICWPSQHDIDNWPAAVLVGSVKYLIVTTREIAEFRLVNGRVEQG